MKGLLIKDFRLLTLQKNFFAAVLLMCIFFLTIYKEPAFMIIYMMMILSFFPVSTISYDEYDNGGVFLFTLPITRKGYVTEKYIFSLLNLTVALLFVSIPTAVAMLLQSIDFSLKDFGMNLLVGSFSVILILSLMIPLQLKFDAEKSRIALMLTALAVFLAGYMVYNGWKAQITGFLLRCETLMDAHVAGFILLALAVLVLLVLISYLISVRIMQKKEY